MRVEIFRLIPLTATATLPATEGVPPADGNTPPSPARSTGPAPC